MSSRLSSALLCGACLIANSAHAQTCETDVDIFAGPLTSKLRPGVPNIRFPNTYIGGPPNFFPGVHLTAANNEFVAFEVFLNNNNCTGATVTNLDVIVSNIVGPSSFAISGNDVTVFREAYQKTTTASTNDVPTGYWPDILIPKVDDTPFHELRCGFYAMSGGTPTDTLATHLSNDAAKYGSCNDSTNPGQCLTSCPNNFLVPNEFRAFVVQIHVPKTAPAGLYQGEVTGTFDAGSTTVNIPIMLNVRHFSLPDTSHLKTSFGLSWNTLADAHGIKFINGGFDEWGVPTDPSKLSYWALLYGRYMLDHRITTNFVLNMMASSRGGQSAQTFINEYSAIFNGLDPNLVLSGAQPTTIRYDGTPRTKLYQLNGGGATQDQAEHQQWWNTLSGQNWSTKTFDQICDEPQHDDVFGVTTWACGTGKSVRINGLDTFSSWTILKQYAASAHALTATFPTLVTTSVAELQKTGNDPTNFLTDVAMPTVIENWYWGKNQSQRTGTTYTHNTGPDYTSAGYLLSNVWWYDDCATTGSCSSNVSGSANDAEFYPNFAIDTALPALNRTMEWLTYRYGIGGELYFDTIVSLRTAWDSVYVDGQNGEGNLLYPGLASRIGGTHDIPLPSLRLLMIRAGFQDYEYLYKLGNELGDTASANAVVDTLFGNIGSPPPTFASSKAPTYLTLTNIEAQRVAIANLIESKLHVGTPAQFTVAVSPATQTVVPGQSGSWTITITPTPGAPPQDVTVDVFDLPPFMNGVPLFDICSAGSCLVHLTTGPATIHMTIGAISQGAGSFMLYVDNGDMSTFGGNGVYKSIPVEAWPAGGTLTLVANPLEMSVPSSQSTQTSVVVTPQAGFATDATLSVSGLPAGASVSFPSGNIVTASNGSAPLVLASGSALAGKYTLTVTAAAGSRTATTSVPFSVGNTSSSSGAQQIRTTFHEDGRAVAFDASGNYVVASNTLGAIPGATNKGANDWLVSKFSSAGGLLWQTQLGDIGDDLATGVAVSGSAEYVVGYTNRSDDLAFAGGLADVMVSKLDPAGAVLWTKLIGTSGDDFAQAVAVDATGNVYIAGSTTGAFGGPNQGGKDAWVGKYDSSLNRLWVAQLGGPGDQIANAVAVDASGNVFIAGSTTTAIRTGTTYLGGTHDAFFAKYSASGVLVWTSEVGTSGDDVAYAMALDASGNLVVAGSTTGGYGFVPQGGIDAWVGKYTSSAGNVIWARNLGSPTDEWATGVALDTAGNVYITGPNNGPLYDHFQGGWDVFVSKFASTGTRQWIKNYGGPGDDFASSVAVGGSTIAVVGSTSGSLGIDSVAGRDVFVALFAP